MIKTRSLYEARVIAGNKNSRIIVTLKDFFYCQNNLNFKLKTCTQ